MGIIMGHILPRLILTIPQILPSTKKFPEYPLPVPIDRELISRLLLLRDARRAAGFAALALCVISGVILRYNGGVVFLGVFISSGWTIAAYLGTFDPNPWPKEMINKIREIVVLNPQECCTETDLIWAVNEIRCSSCSKINHNLARPLLGRTRPDGVLGIVRFLLDEGHPPNPSLLEERG